MYTYCATQNHYQDKSLLNNNNTQIKLTDEDKQRIKLIITEFTNEGDIIANIAKPKRQLDEDKSEDFQNKKRKEI